MSALGRKLDDSAQSVNDTDEKKESEISAMPAGLVKTADEVAYSMQSK